MLSFFKSKLLIQKVRRTARKTIRRTNRSRSQVFLLLEVLEDRCLLSGGLSSFSFLPGEGLLNLTANTGSVTVEPSGNSSYVRLVGNSWSASSDPTASDYSPSLAGATQQSLRTVTDPSTAQLTIFNLTLTNGLTVNATDVTLTGLLTSAGNLTIRTDQLDILGQVAAGTITLGDGMVFLQGGSISADQGPIAFGMGSEVQIFGSTTLIARTSIEFDGRLSILDSTATMKASNVLLGPDTFLDAGTLQTEGTVVVPKTGDLAGIGAITGPVLVDATGTVSPGLSNGGIGQLTLDDGIVFSAGSQFVVHLAVNGDGVPITDSLYVPAGTIALNNASVRINVSGFTPNPNNRFTIVTDNNDSVTGTFGSEAVTATTVANGFAANFPIFYNQTATQGVVLGKIDIPEPLPTLLPTPPTPVQIIELPSAPSVTMITPPNPLALLLVGGTVVIVTPAKPLPTPAGSDNSPPVRPIEPSTSRLLTFSPNQADDNALNVEDLLKSLSQPPGQPSPLAPEEDIMDEGTLDAGLDSGAVVADVVNC
jgi:hypothetical protein